MGHGVRTQEAYYLRVLPEYFERVTMKNHALYRDFFEIENRCTNRGTFLVKTSEN